MPAHNPELAPLFNLFGLSSNYPISELLAAVEDCKRRADRDSATSWIKCADELPELDTPVWIRTADDIIVIAERGSSTDGWMWSACYGQFFADGKWDAVDGDASDEYEPTHWMALPIPPADEGGEPMSQIKERPILFSAPMVRAIQEGRKTVTRRVVKPWQQPKLEDDGTWFAVAQRDRRYGFGVSGADAGECASALAQYGCFPYGSVGDRLWLRETHFINDYREAKVPEAERADTEIVYRADPLPCWEGEESEIRWRPSIFMPRWSSRILLEITAVRVEPLQDISEEQSEAEGVYFLRAAPDFDETLTAKQLYEILWDHINGNGAWDANPWVWVVEFKRVTA